MGSDQPANVVEGATWQLARFAADARLDALPDAVRREGVRAFVNWAGCALGAPEHESVVTMRDALAVYSAPAEASILGTKHRFNMMQAALLNSTAASVRVFEDTYLSATVHPTSPVAAAALAVAEHLHVTGEELLAAVIVGDEITCRAANMLTRPPARSHLGLYMTGIAGGIGAAAGAARLMKLDARGIVWAMSLAVLHASGVRALHGHHSTYLMAGNAARAGVLGAILAKVGLTSAEHVLEAPRGFADVFASPANIAAATEGLGSVFEILDLTYKPYPCSVVVHAGIDGCLQLVRAHDFDAAAIESVEIDICPAGMELASLRHPKSHMNSRGSLHHWAASALLYRRASIAEEGKVNEPDIIALRDRIEARADAALAADAGRVRIKLRDGAVLETFIDHCVGSRDRPMTDTELDEKFLSQAALSLTGAKAERALALCRGIAGIDDAAALALAMT